MDFRLRFPAAAIPQWAAAYEYAGEKELLATVPRRVKRAGYLTKDDLIEIGVWKSPRIRSRIASNDDGLVREVILVASFAFTACATRDCCCPCSALPVAVETQVALALAVPSLTTSDLVHRSEFAREGAQSAWTDEITAGTIWLAGCLLEAAKEADAAAGESKRKTCIEQFDARMKINDETYEQVKQVIGK